MMKKTEYDSFDNNYVLVVTCFCKDLISISSIINGETAMIIKIEQVITVQNFPLIGVDAV